MIELAGLYLPRDDTLQRVSSVLQLPVNDRKQHGRSTTGYRLAEAFLRPILAVLSVDCCFLGSRRPQRNRRIFHLDIRALGDELIGGLLMRLLTNCCLFTKEFLSFCHEFLTTLGRHETAALLERAVFVVRLGVRCSVGTIYRTVDATNRRINAFTVRSQFFDNDGFRRIGHQR